MSGEVWVLECVLDHEPGWIKGVYTSMEKAKAAVPQVTSWTPSSFEDRGLYEAGAGMSAAWAITPYPLDPSTSEGEGA